MKKFILAAVLACLLAAGTALAESAGGTPVYSADDLFTKRDLKQAADLEDAVSLEVSGGTDLHITEPGVYILTGSAAGVTVWVEAEKKDKVQLVLDGLEIVNENFPCIYVKKADKVFVTLSADSSLSVTGAFRADGDNAADGVIFSRTDLVLNGTASLAVSSPDNGIVCKDDLKITGGVWEITAAGRAFDANDSIRISGGIFRLVAGTDGLHARNKEDDSLGYIFVGGGDFSIEAGEDGIDARSVLQIDGGTLAVSAPEGLEGACVQINGGTVSVTAETPCDCKGKTEFNGGALFVGGEDVTETPERFFGTR